MVRRLLAFWRTVGWAVRHPLRLARQGSRDVDYRSARRFWFWSATIGAIFAGPLLFMIYYEDVRAFVLVRTDLDAWLGGSLTEPTSIDRLIEWSIALSAGAAGWLWLLLASGVPSYFFHPRRLDPPDQERAIALSYYGSGPLAVAGLAMVGWFVVFGTQDLATAVNHAPRWAQALVSLVLLGSIGIPLLLAWLVPAVLMVAGAGLPVGRAMAMLLITGIAWILLLPICLVLLLAVFYGYYVYFLLSY